jgi:hypothetical protein
MADAVTFHAALGRIGLNHNTQLAINANGLTTIFDLIEAQKGDLVNLPKHIRDWHIADAVEDDQVRIPLMSLWHLKAMRYWAPEQTYVGVLPSATSFTPAVLAKTLANMKNNEVYKAVTKAADIKKPPLLTDLAKWPTFWEVMTYFSCIKGSANTPLTYLVREHGDVMPVIMAASKCIRTALHKVCSNRFV